MFNRKDKKLSDSAMLNAIQRSGHQNKPAYSFLSIWLIGFIIFTVGPFFFTIYLSFQDVQLTGLGWEYTNINMDNYITAFFGNIDFVPALISFITLEITYVPAIVIFSFILGILLNRNIKFRSGFRTIFFLPVIVLSGSVMDQLMFNGSTTLRDFSENIIFTMLLNYSPFFARMMLELFQNFTMVLWFTGIPIILFINGLQKINRSLFEAAKIDGATGWQILWKITIPIIKPTALVVAIFTIVQIGMYNINPIFGLIRDSMYNFQGGLGLSSAYAIVYTTVVLAFVGVAFMVLGTRSDKKDIKLSSIQRARFEIIRNYRLEQANKKREEKLRLRKEKRESRTKLRVDGELPEVATSSDVTSWSKEQQIAHKKALKKQRQRDKVQYKLRQIDEDSNSELVRLELLDDYEGLKALRERIEQDKQAIIAKQERRELLDTMSKEEKAKFLAKEREEHAARKEELRQQKVELRAQQQAEKAEQNALRKEQREKDKAIKAERKQEIKEQRLLEKAQYEAGQEVKSALQEKDQSPERHVDFKTKVIRTFTTKKYFFKFASNFVIYALLITISYVFLFPFISMLSLSLMSQADVINVEIDYIPSRLYLGNYAVSMVVLDGWNALWNSIWFSSVLAIAQTVISALTGYAFARYQFRAKGLLFALILVSFIVPVPIIFIPRFMMFIGAQSATGIKLIGTVVPQMLMSLFGQGVNSAILILIFYNFFKLIPNVLYEAAKIDGASPFKQFWEITIKMSMSTIVVVFLFSFVWNWNETYITQQLVGDNMVLMPSQLGIFDTLFQNRAPAAPPGQEGEVRVNEAYRMAATLLSMLPLFIIYFVAQRQFVEGIEKTGITGE